MSLAASQLAAQTPAEQADSMFRSLDANSDGRLTLQDANDTNRDMLRRVIELSGRRPDEGLSRAEFQQVFDRQRGGGRPQTPPGTQPPRPMTPSPGADSAEDDEDETQLIMLLADANGDGKLSRAEWGRIAQQFSRMDTNKDNALDLPELEAAAKAAAETNGAALKSGRAAANAEASSSNGMWRGWIVEGRGDNPNAGQMQIELTVEGNRMAAREIGTRRAPQGGLGAGTFTATGDGRSGFMDATYTEGEHRGQVCLGIYQMEGDTLRWCVSNRPGQRPDDYSTGRGNWLLILQRVPTGS